jgi:hypothetical protein
MLTSSVAMPQLFAQLGLASSDFAIARFIKQHHLTEDIPLQDASFWTPTQQQFIKESLREDSDWCEVIDQLNALLRH